LFNIYALIPFDRQDGDYTLGIFQSIGFKEFHPYLILSDEERQSDKGQALFNQGLLFF
jgi:tRNA dimethylallyltransferase